VHVAAEQLIDSQVGVDGVENVPAGTHYRAADDFSDEAVEGVAARLNPAPDVESAVEDGATVNDGGSDVGNVPAGTPLTGDPTCHVQGLGGIEPETARRLSCDADVVGAVVTADGEVLTYGRTRRLVSRAQRRALIIRDGLCQFPGCHQIRHLHAHHRVSWPKADSPTWTT
jgi:hypothetical protein